MATEKPGELGTGAPAARRPKANVPPTHPTVWVGLGLAVIGLLLATYAYTGARVYDILFAFVALGGAFLALIGILTAAWGRSIMSARASRARRSAIRSEALALGAESAAQEATVAAPEPASAPVKSKRRGFSFGRGAKNAAEKPAAKSAVFAFRRQQEAPVQSPSEPAAAVASGPAESGGLVRVKLRCPDCTTSFVVEGERPFLATCTSCGFSAEV